jgi:hypothetical protein
MKISTNLQRSDFNSLANVIDYAFTQKMFDLNTLMVCVFNNYDGTEPEYAQVTQLINNIDALGNSLTSPFQFYVPIGYLMGGNAGIHITYKKGDLVLVGYSQQSLSTLKNSWDSKINNPTQLNPLPLNYGKFTLEDGIILCKVSATLPTTLIDIQETGITITSNDQPIIINSGEADATINCTNAIINATTKVNITASEVDINSSNVNLGGTTGAGVLTTATIMNFNGTIGGQPASGTVTTTSGSTTVKATS